MMKNLSKFCPEIFKSKLGCVFLIAQLVFFAFVVDLDKMFLPIESIEESRYSSATVKEPPSFGCYHCEEPFETKTAFVIISLPTAIVTSYLLVDLKNQHPHWSYERFVIIGNLAFLFFNSFYWLVLGYGIERLHEHYLKIRSEPEKPFTIFSGSD